MENSYLSTQLNESHLKSIISLPKGKEMFTIQLLQEQLPIAIKIAEQNFLKLKITLFYFQNHRKGWRFCMFIPVSDELQLFAQEIQSFLSPNALRDLARDVGFV